MCDLIDCKDCRYNCKLDMSDSAIEKLWKEFEDVLFIEDSESGDSCQLVLVSDWQGWDKGTCRDTIWDWFDKQYSKGIYWLLYGIKYNKKNESLMDGDE